MSKKNLAELPKGWEIKTLGEVIKLEYGKPLPDGKRISFGKYPLYGANGEKGRTNEYYYDKKTIIVGRKGSAGELNLTEEKFWPLDVTYFVTFDEKRYNLTFLYHLLNLLELPKLAKGVKPGINRNEVYSITTKFPPLPEQHRIVSILDEALAAIARAKANAEQNLKNAKALFETLLSKIFIDGINVKKWNLEKLEKYNKVVVGYVGPISSEYTIDSEGVLLLSTKNISNKGISLEKLTRINHQFHDKNKKSQLLPGDILVARHGNSGQAAVIPKNIKEAHALNVIVIKRSEILSSEYICFLLNSGVLDKIAASKAGSVQEIINTGIIKDLIIPVPTLKAQQSIVQKLDALSAETKKLEAIYQKKIDDLEELKKSILQKAFNGEL